MLINFDRFFNSIKYSNTSNLLINFWLIGFPLFVILGSAVINLFFLISSIILALIIFKKKFNFKLHNNNFIIIFCIILIYQCITGFFVENDFYSFGKSISQIRFLLFLLLIIYLSKFKFSFEKLINYQAFLIILVCLDGFYQFFYKVNLFGFRIDPLNPNRIGGVFNQELIFGSFIFLVSIPIISSLLYDFKTHKLSKKIFTTLFISTSFLAVLLSGERISFILFFLCLITIFFINFNFKKVIILFFLILIFTSTIIIKNKSINNRVKAFYNEISLLKKQNHIRLFSGGINIWREHPLLGVGIKNYRNICDQNKFDQFTKIKTLCSTHPHNFYIEILVETGVIGLSLYITFFILLARHILVNLKKISKKLKGLYIGYALIIFCYIWPIKSSGSFFSTFTASFFWFYMAIILFIEKKNKEI